ncbi:MAG: phospho-sugar mutase, partial [Lachnospiraceae bacterium]|nr:phospho-sugar mutase [Lachnospiraceae bacterium]
TQFTLTMKGAEGATQIAALMDKLRNDPPKAFGDLEVLKFRDYKKDVIVDMKTGEKTTTGLPSSNVLYFDLPDDNWCCVRPSGTEPKIKFYMGVKGTSLEDAAAKSAALTEAVKAFA